MTRAALKLCHEIEQLFARLVRLTSPGQCNQSRILRAQKKRNSLINRGLNEFPEESAIWYQFKSFACSQHSANLRYLLLGYRHAKRRRNIREQMNAARFLAEEYAERKEHRTQALKWLNILELLGQKCEGRGLKKWCESAKHSILETLNPSPQKASSTQKFYLPQTFGAPSAILQLKNNCGPLIIWSVLKYFKRRANAADIIKHCHYDPAHGTHAIGIAICLKHYNLEVSYHGSDHDTPENDELFLFRQAHSIGIPIQTALTLNDLAKHISNKHVPIVCYEARQGGHFAAITKVTPEKVNLHLGVKRELSRKTFLKNWNNNVFHANCVLV
jgi:hypothetical protein